MKLNRSVYYEPLHANSDEDISTTSWSGGRFASWTTRTRKDHRRRADSQCQKVPGAGYIASLCLAQHEFPRRETFMGWQLAGISQLSTTRYRSVVTVKRPASFKFSRAEHGSGIVAVVIAAIYRLRPPLPPGLAVVGGLHFRKVSYVTGARERGEAVCDAAWTTQPPSSRLKFENRFYRGWNLPRCDGILFSLFLFLLLSRNTERSCIVLEYFED